LHGADVQQKSTREGCAVEELVFFWLVITNQDAWIARIMDWTRLRQARTHLLAQRRRAELSKNGLPDLLHRIWGLDSNAKVLQPAAYWHHYCLVHSMLDGNIISFPDREAVIDLLDAVKKNRHVPMSQTKEHLKAANQRWIGSRDNDKAASEAIKFAMQLWLMIQPAPQIHLDDYWTLKEIIAQSLELASTASSLSRNTPSYERLSPDFGAKNLIRIGGIEIIWTGFLSEHLLFKSRNELKVFEHASLLRQYAKSSER
jgi:hypothetical protein